MIDAIGTTLRARLPDGSVREGAALVGAILVVSISDRTMRLRIAAVEPDTLDPRGEVLLYDLRVVTEVGEGPLCGADPDGRRLAMPLAGRNDSTGILRQGNATDFELVCTSGAQGKCMRLGYGPWRQMPDGHPMRNWYNACVRMLRGDYCGDGRPHTRDGTLIDVYDRIGVQTSNQDPRMSFEAAWNADGAVCVARTRVPDIIDLSELGCACPRLAGSLGPTACDESAPGGLIFNRSRQ